MKRGIVMLVNEKFDNGKAFDWGLTSEDYAKYRDIYPKELYQRLKELGVANDSTAWLDLGTGTGVLPQNLYNEKASITAVDITEEQINYARLIAKKNNWNINYLVSPAESTNLSDNSFDTITAAECVPAEERLHQWIKKHFQNGIRLIENFYLLVPKHLR